MGTESHMELTDEIIQGLIGAVRDASRKEILPRFRNLTPESVASKSGPDDLVTVADIAAEAMIAKEVAGWLPGALIIGEEAVEDDPSLLDALPETKLAVIIDPIDGTTNFASGLAVFGVILAVLVDGETVFGLLYDPVMDDWVMAQRGKGAWYVKPGKSPRRLHGPGAKQEAECHGYIPLVLYPASQRARIASTFPRYKRVSCLHCSCHEYRMLALGHADFIVSPIPKPWDHAAGVLVVEECGGVVFSGMSSGYDPCRPRSPLVSVGDIRTQLATDQFAIQNRS